MERLSTVDGLAQLAFLVHGTLELRASEHGLSMIQTRLLGVLRDRTPTINELGALLGLDKSSTSGLVVRAERRGLVTRTASKADGRAVHVASTAAARSLIDAIATQFEADVHALLAPLAAADRARLDALVGRILAADASARGIALFPDSDPPSTVHGPARSSPP